MLAYKSFKLGAQVLSKVSRFSKSASQAPTTTPRIPHVPLAQNLSLLGRELFSTTATDSADGGNAENQKITVTFVDKDGEETQIKVPIGGNAENQKITVTFVDKDGEETPIKVPIGMNMLEPTNEENDMLDLAFGLTETSHRGCQVIAKPELDGLRLALPAATRNFAVDGFKPKPH